MAREVTIVVAVKNAVNIGLSKAKKSINDFGSSIYDIGTKIGAAFLGVGTAVAGFALKAISAYAEAEAAQRSLEGALRAYGDEVPVNVERVKQFTAAIQDETGADGDNLVARAARLRMLGVEPASLEAATKATVALKSAGMDEEAAIKAVAMAHSGNFSALSRYIPALKSATTEADKARIVNDFLARGYAQQKDNLNSVSGQWGLLKERVGDVWEEIGKAISQNDALSGVIGRVSQAVKDFGARLSEWVSGGGLTEFVSIAKLGFENLRMQFGMVGNGIQIVWASISDGATTLFTYLGGIISGSVAVWKAEFIYFKDVAEAAWEAVKHPIEKGFVAPSTEPIKAALDDLANAYTYTEVQVTEKTQQALADREMLVQDHVLRVAEIEKQRTEDYDAQLNKRLEDEKVQLAASLENNKATAEGIAKVAEDLTGKLADEAEKRTEKDTTFNSTNSAEENDTSVNWGGDSRVTAIGRSMVQVQGPAAFNGIGLNGSLTNSAGMSVQGLRAFSGYSFSNSTNYGTLKTNNDDIVSELKLIRQQQDKLNRLG